MKLFSYYFCALKSCDFAAGAAGGNPTRHHATAKASAQTTKQLPNTILQAKKVKNRTATQREPSDTRDPRRGSRTVRDAPLRERFDKHDLHRVHRAQDAFALRHAQRGSQKVGR